MTRALVFLSLFGVILIALAIPSFAGKHSTFEAWSLLATGEAPAWMRILLLDIRAPRVVLAGLCGIGLAASGAAMQGLFRNPLADPGLLGAAPGAACLAVLALYLLPTSLAVAAVPVAALMGASLALIIVLYIGRRRQSREGTTLLLAGLAVSTVASALCALVLSLSLSRWEVGRELLAWLMGGLDGRSWEHVWIAALPVTLGSTALLFYGRELDALASGHDSALGLGVDVGRTTLYVCVAIAALTGVTVAVGGVIGFVGLVVPHIARRSGARSTRELVFRSCWLGAGLVIAADCISRTAAQLDLRLGVLTSAIGGPYFIYLLLRRHPS